MAERNIPVREELVAEIEKVARAQNRTVEEVLDEALDRYIKDRQWVSVKSYGRAKARERNVTEEDVDKAIAEVRSTPGR
jgi:predicted transcriptional regulator